jgi:hypothetical protein
MIDGKCGEPSFAYWRRKSQRRSLGERRSPRGWGYGIPQTSLFPNCLDDGAFGDALPLLFYAHAASTATVNLSSSMTPM